MKLELVGHPDNPFLAEGCGAGLAPGVRCGHGHPAFGIHLMGSGLDEPDPDHPGVRVVLPRCVAAQLIGTLNAIVSREGQTASEEFTRASDAAYQETLAALGDFTAQGRLCCEAGFRTAGREHTCGTNGPRQ